MSNTLVATPCSADPGLAGKLLNVGFLGLSRGAGIAAQMAVQIVVGSLAGPAGIGTLQLHMAWSSLLGELVGGGEATAAMREHSLRRDRASRLLLRPSLWTAIRKILAYTALLFVIAGLLRLAGLLPAEQLSSRALIVSALIAAPLFAVTRLLAETLKALDHAFWAVTLENSLTPLVILGICGLLALGALPLTQTLLLAAAVSGLLFTLALMGWLLLHHSKVPGPSSDTAHLAEPRIPGNRERLHFWLNGLLNIAFLQLPFLILPWLASTESIGGYAVAHKLINVITTLLILLSALYGPRFARAANAGDRAALAGLLRETQQISLLLFVPAAALMLIGSAPLAGLFQLAQGELLPLLIILAAGQLLNAATGLSGVLLNMSGAAKAEFRILLTSCALTLPVALALGFFYGAPGVATGAAAGIVLRNVASYIAARAQIKALGEH